jgi:hypothetical protein
MLNKRKSEGEYWTLHKELIGDEEFFKNIRSSQYQFNELLVKKQSGDK